MSIQYFIVTLGILLAKIVGFLRDIIFAGKFGATAASDIYFGVFGVVTLLFTGIGIALSTLAIKNLGRLELGTENERRAYVSSFITRTFIFTAAGAALMAVFARALVAVLLPDLREDMIPTAVTVTRIMTPSLCFVCVAYVISGVLQNSRRFFIPSIVSLPYNVILIAQLLFTDPDVIAVSVVTTIGWGLHIVFQLPQFYRLGYRMFSRGGKGSFGVGEAAAIFASNMGFQLCFIITGGSSAEAKARLRPSTTRRTCSSRCRACSSWRCRASYSRRYRKITPRASSTMCAGSSAR